MSDFECLSFVATILNTTITAIHEKCSTVTVNQKEICMSETRILKDKEERSKILKL